MNSFVGGGVCVCYTSGGIILVSNAKGYKRICAAIQFGKGSLKDHVDRLDNEEPPCFFLGECCYIATTFVGLNYIFEFLDLVENNFAGDDYIHFLHVRVNQYFFFIKPHNPTRVSIFCIIPKIRTCDL